MRLWKLAKVAAAVVLGALCVNQAQAGMVSYVHNSYGGTAGGEYIFEVDSPVLAGTSLTAGSRWETFCLEKDENLGRPLPRQFNAVLNTAAVNGGISGGNPDPLSRLTAYLYSSFVDQTLASAGYTFDTSNYAAMVARGASADALQNVIWYIEGEMAKSWADGDGSLEDKFYSFAKTANPDGIGYVRVLNLTDPTTGELKQDVLVIGNSEYVMPVPAAAWMGLALLGGAGLVRVARRRQA